MVPRASDNSLQTLSFMLTANVTKLHCALLSIDCDNLLMLHSTSAVVLCRANLSMTTERESLSPLYSAGEIFKT
jgi:hypothetical protein